MLSFSPPPVTLLPILCRRPSTWITLSSSLFMISSRRWEVSLRGKLALRKGDSVGARPPLDDVRFFVSPSKVGVGKGEFMRDVYCSLASQPTSWEGVLAPPANVPVRHVSLISLLQQITLNIPMAKSEFEWTSWFSCAELIAVEGLGARPP